MNTMAQDRLNSLAMLSMEKYLIQTFLSFTPKSLRGFALHIQLSIGTLPLVHFMSLCQFFCVNL